MDLRPRVAMRFVKALRQEWIPPPRAKVTLRSERIDSAFAGVNPAQAGRRRRLRALQQRCL